MQHLITPQKLPQSTVAVDANQSRDINLVVESSEVVLARLAEVLGFLGLSSLTINPVATKVIIPDGMPHVWLPEPKALLAAMGQKLSPAQYSALCLRLLCEYGDTLGEWLKLRLQNGLIKPDPTNVNSWRALATGQPEGTINAYERGFSPITRFKFGEQVVNLPATDGRKPLLQAGLTPGALLEWAILFKLCPGLKAEIIRVDPWVVHPGTRVRGGVLDWSGVSSCDEWDGRADCDGRWDDGVDPRDSLFSLL